MSKYPGQDPSDTGASDTSQSPTRSGIFARGHVVHRAGVPEGVPERHPII